MKRFLIWLMLAAGCSLPACGSSPTVNQGDDSAEDDDGDRSDRTGGGTGTDTADGVSPHLPDGGFDDDYFDDYVIPGCEPVTCEDQGYDCGPVSNGCGGIIQCGKCDEGSECGIVDLNVCTPLEDLCVPIPKAEACEDKECGRAGNGCGGSYNCGSCEEGQACGRYEAFQCGDAPEHDDESCGALIASCEEADVECGETGNGCGGTLDCGGCPNGEICGIVAPSQCDPPPACRPLTPEQACDGRCGVVSNGCGAEIDGGLIDCSDHAEFACPAGTACGAGGVANTCGSGESACTPLSQNDACDGRSCGVVSDGCSSSYICGSCTEDARCNAGACEPLCTPMTITEACQGKECGIAYDGCGFGAENTFDCATVGGGCGAGEFCGINEPFQCSSPYPANCTAGTSCAQMGWACGTAVDACGNTFNCANEGRSCLSTETCIGGITGPTECQDGFAGGGGNCGLCASIPRNCAGNSPTRLTGRVITPGRDNSNTANQVGVPNAFVYILRNNNEAELPAIASGIPTNGTSCDRCDQQDLGPVLAGTTTNAQGEFTLEGNIPVGVEFVLVVKVGKFRRAVKHTLAAGAACTTTNLTAQASTLTRLPRDMSDGLRVNIPRIAISTGEIDAMECVFEKMGIAHSEFVNGSATTTGARIHLYRGGNGQQGARVGSGNGTPDSDLYGDLSRLQSYDMLVADCEGTNWDSAFSQRGDPTSATSNATRIRQYLNRGGRMFASHLSFSWLHQNSTQAYVAGTFATTGLGQAATWDTSAIGPGTNTGSGVVSLGRPNASPRIQSFASWLASESVPSPFTIAEPRSQVATAAGSLGASTEEFVHCGGGDCVNGRTQQFSFNTPYAAPVAATCGRVAYSGFHVSAGGGGGVVVGAGAQFPNLCRSNTNPFTDTSLTNQEKVLLYMLFDLGACIGEDPPPPTCTAMTCGDVAGCGTVPNGCGGTMQCPCACVPSTCQAQGATCGIRSDGCGGVLNCGPCECVGATQCPGTVQCGVFDDGCGNPINCGTCPPPQTCINGLCGIPACPGLTCTAQNAQCGWVGDGCGAALNCGNCPPGQFCQNNACVGCQPRTCAQAGAQCGAIGDGCGGIVQCGPCPQGQVCGINQPNQCGPPGQCSPLTCQAADAECGMIGDGCGDVVDCGPCPPGQVCGIESPNKCGPPPQCTPRTCEEQNAECGLIGNGCGNVVDCGACPPGETCGLHEPNQCGSTGTAK